jgi:hypothetical protein
MNAPDCTELLAQIGAEFCFLTPVEPGSWPDRPAALAAVDARPPGRQRIVIALGPGVAEAIEANLGATANADEIACEVANIVAGHLFPALPGAEAGFLPPVRLGGLTPPPGTATGVVFAEGGIGLAILETATR